MRGTPVRRGPTDDERGMVPPPERTYAGRAPRGSRLTVRMVPRGLAADDLPSTP